MPPLCTLPKGAASNDVFFALSDPVRRGIVERLQSGPLLVSELAEPFAVSMQAVSRHIQVLEDAGLVQKERTGRMVAWLNRYSSYWQGQFAQLTATLQHGESTARTARQKPEGDAPPPKPRAPKRAKRNAAKDGG